MPSDFMAPFIGVACGILFFVAAYLVVGLIIVGYYMMFGDLWGRFASPASKRETNLPIGIDTLFWRTIIVWFRWPQVFRKDSEIRRVWLKQL